MFTVTVNVFNARKIDYMTSNQRRGPGYIKPMMHIS